MDYRPVSYYLRRFDVRRTPGALADKTSRPLRMVGQGMCASLVGMIITASMPSQHAHRSCH